MKIKMLVMDVDGTLTDGCIYISPTGEAFKAFNVKDGYAIAHILPTVGAIPVIITGRKSDIVSLRCKELGITHCYQGVSDKLSVLKELALEIGAVSEQIAYIGDDINDLDCIRFCGFTACPSDAADEVKKVVDYVCKNQGGKGAVREFIEHIERF
ncbi:MAG: 3-deoxy-D-manno-octulosonate 8-phosphate phosphatase [Ruminococcaceae bacterium]|nr:3-deoxy-D-manno-octulosonate 8-phosphate phosphatase [Oscillospiraceae bacterium]